MYLTEMGRALQCSTQCKSTRTNGCTCLARVLEKLISVQYQQAALPHSQTS